MKARGQEENRKVSILRNEISAQTTFLLISIKESQLVNNKRIAFDLLFTLILNAYSINNKIKFFRNK
jgi:hypothetical protein